MELPKKILWPRDKERPKTLWLKLGFKRLGIPVRETPHNINKFKVPRNPLGPYVYPIKLRFENKSAWVLYDIGTIPKIIHGKHMMGKGRFYFKIHCRLNEDKRIIPAPNSSSRMAYLEHLEEIRKIKKEKEYKHDMTGLFWHDDRGLRRKCIETSRKMGLKGPLGLQKFKRGPKVPPGLKEPKLPYFEHLKAQAQSKLNLALPGGMALPYCSFRHVELWGMGAAVLTIKPDAKLVGEPKDCWVEFKRDMSDFEQIVKYYLTHDAEREKIADNGLRYFEEHLTPEAHAKYIIAKVLERLE